MLRGLLDALNVTFIPAGLIVMPRHLCTPWKEFCTVRKLSVFVYSYDMGHTFDNIKRGVLMNEKVAIEDKSLRTAFLATASLLLLAVSFGIVFALSGNTEARVDGAVPSQPEAEQAIARDAREVRRFQDITSTTTDLNLVYDTDFSKTPNLLSGRQTTEPDAG